MKQYEAVIILDNSKIEDGGEVFIKSLGKYIKTLGGNVREENSMGRKQFARPIKKITAGTYWNLMIDMDPTQVEVLKEHYALNEIVVRIGIFSFDQKKQAPKKEKSDS